MAITAAMRFQPERRSDIQNLVADRHAQPSADRRAVKRNIANGRF